MATPIGASALVAALKKEGVRVVEVSGWRTHNRNHVGPWGPVHGVMIHHTVTSGSARTVEICRTGYPGLPGPLCHGVITKDGRVHLVGHGRANHAGLGDGDVLRAAIDEQEMPPDNEANTDGNRHFYGFECENLGDGEDPWPAAQLDAIERVAAALCRHHGWKAESVIGHLEWQPGKVDPRGFSMNTLRSRIAARLAGTPAPGPAPEPSGGTYTVDEDDTLWSIAAEQLGDGTRYLEIARLNGITDPDLVRAGQQLRLPGNAPAPAAPKPGPAPAFPGREHFRLGARNRYALQLQEWLHKGDWGPRYKHGPSTLMTRMDLEKVAALQRHYIKDLGPADGLVGPRTWQYAYEVAVGLRKK